MKKIYGYLGLLLLILPFGKQAFAQQTLVDIDPIRYYNEAIDLYQNKKYSASIARFDQYYLYGSDFLLNAQGDLYTAKAAMQMRLNNTEDLFVYYLNTYPELAEEDYVYFLLGKYYFDRKKYSNCLDWLKKIHFSGVLDPEDANAYNFMYAYVLYKDKDYSKALNYFKKVDGSRNYYFNLANYYMGYIYYLQGSYEEALKRFTKITKDKRFSKLMPVYITHLYLNLEKYDKVIEFGQKALSNTKVQKAQNIKAYIAEAYFYKMEYDRSIRYYSELHDSHFSFTDDDNYHYGYALFRAKKYSDAIETFNRISLKKDAMGQNIAYLVGTAYLLEDQKLKARNAYGFAAGLDFDMAIKETSELNYAKLSYDLNFHKEAIDGLRKFMENFPKSESVEEAKTLIGEILLSTADYYEAMHIIEGMKERNATINNAYQKVSYFAGLDNFQNGNYSHAKNMFVNSIKSKGQIKIIRAKAYFWLGESYFQLGELENAIREYKNFLYIGESKSSPYYSLAYYNIGYCHYKKSEYENARTYFDKYLSLEKDHNATERTYDVILRLADCNFSIKNYTAASQYYKINIEKGFKEKDYALFQLATIQGLLNDNVGKESSLNRIINEQKNSPYVDDALFELANMNFIVGEYATSKGKFEHLISTYPKSPYYASALLKIGLCDYNLGNIDQALSQLQSIVERFKYAPEAKEADNAIKSIYVGEGRGTEYLLWKEKNHIQLNKSEEEAIVYESAMTYIKSEKYDLAIPEFEKYLKKFPHGYYELNSNYYIAICADYLNLGDKALTHYEKVNELSPNQYMEKTLKAAAELYYDKGNYDKAGERFKQLEEIAINKANVKLAISGQMRSFYKTGKYNECISYCTKLIEHPFANEDDKLEANFLAARSHFELLHYDMAKTAFEAIAAQNFSKMGAESKYMVAYILYLNQDYENCLNTIVELKNNYAGNDYYIAKGFILLSDVFVKTDDLFQAKHTLESIIENYDGEDILKIANEKLARIEEMEKQAEKEKLEKENQFIEVESDTIK